MEWSTGPNTPNVLYCHLETCTTTEIMPIPTPPLRFHFHPRPSPSSFSSIPIQPAKISFLSNPFPQNCLFFNKKSFKLTKADILICDTIIIKHVPKVLYTKVADGGIICWCRCIIDVKYSYIPGGGVNPVRYFFIPCSGSFTTFVFIPARAFNTSFHPFCIAWDYWSPPYLHAGFYCQ